MSCVVWLRGCVCLPFLPFAPGERSQGVNSQRSNGLNQTNLLLPHRAAATARVRSSDDISSTRSTRPRRTSTRLSTCARSGIQSQRVTCVACGTSPRFHHDDAFAAPDARASPQLALHLRNAMVKGTKDAMQHVYSWQFLNCLRAWAAVLGARRTPPELKALVHPLVQVRARASSNRRPPSTVVTF